MMFMVLPQFLGHTEVDQPKGTEVVRDAVRKLKVSYCSFKLAAQELLPSGNRKWYFS